MTPKQYREIKRALTRFKELVYFEEALRKWKNTKFLEIDKVVVSRALVSLQEFKNNSHKGREIGDCLECPYLDDKEMVNYEKQI